MLSLICLLINTKVDSIHRLHFFQSMALSHFATVLPAESNVLPNTYPVTFYILLLHFLLESIFFLRYFLLQRLYCFAQ